MGLYSGIPRTIWHIIALLMDLPTRELSYDRLAPASLGALVMKRRPLARHEQTRAGHRASREVAAQGHEILRVRVASALADVQRHGDRVQQLPLRLERVFAHQKRDLSIAQEPVREAAFSMSELKIGAIASPDRFQAQLIAQQGANRHTKSRALGIAEEVFPNAGPDMPDGGADIQQIVAVDRGGKLLVEFEISGIFEEEFAGVEEDQVDALLIR